MKLGQEMFKSKGEKKSKDEIEKKIKKENKIKRVDEFGQKG
jgi:hypothetical protein